MQQAVDRVSKSKLNLRNKLFIYKTCSLPQLTHELTLWGERILNKTLRMIVNDLRNQMRSGQPIKLEHLLLHPNLILAVALTDAHLVSIHFVSTSIS